jgi:3-dehydroquinate dehydratase II
MSRLFHFLNGPNLNLLGERQPHIHSHEMLADVEASCRKIAGELKLDLHFHQSDREYEPIDRIDEARERAGGLANSPGAFTHTPVAIQDALNACDVRCSRCTSPTSTGARASATTPTSRCAPMASSPASAPKATRSPCAGWRGCSTRRRTRMTGGTGPAMGAGLMGRAGHRGRVHPPGVGLCN